MSNGNGTQLDNNPLWTWIRPVSVILFGIMAFVLLVCAGFFALASGNWTVVGVIVGVGLAFLGVAFGLRTLDKMLETGINLTSMNGMAIGNKAELPKVISGQSTVATPFFEPLDDVSAVDEFDTWDENPSVDFDATKFESEVKRDTLGQYGEENPATLFYEALAKTEGVAASWKFNNMQALKDCRKFILGLAEKAFAWKWGVPYDDAVLHLNDPAGCTTCSAEKQACCTWPDIDFKARQLGMDYYVALRYYREAKQKVDDLGG